MWWRRCLAVVLTGCNSTGVVGSGADLGSGSGGSPSGNEAGSSNQPAGGSGTAAASGNGPGACAETAPPPAQRVRRLTKVELESALGALLGDLSTRAFDNVDTDPQIDGRYTNSDQLVASASFLSGLKLAADAIGADFRATVGSDSHDGTCFTSDEAGESCAETFIQSFGERAYRRVLGADDVADLMRVYAAGREVGVDGDPGDRFATGLSWVVRAVVQAPDFMYLTELGDADASSGSTTPMLPREIASALSFSVVGTAPDAALEGAAAEGRLSAPAARVEQAARLIATYPEGWQRQMRLFVSQWLGINFNKPEWVKDTAAAPLFSGALKSALQTETNLLIDDWAIGTSGTRLDLLLTGSNTFVNSLNAPLYGVAATGADFVKTSLDPTRRAGILTLAGFLGSTSHTGATSPVMRGQAIMERLLCRQLPPPPADVPPLPPPSPEAPGTTRARYERHLSDPSCGGCHALFDPMGFAFEAYDALGVHRVEENGVPIDSTGAFVTADGNQIPVASAVELVNQLARSPEVHACVARQVFRFTVNRDEVPGDECVLEAATRSLGGGSGSLSGVVLTIVGSDRFVTRQVHQ